MSECCNAALSILKPFSYEGSTICIQDDPLGVLFFPNDSRELEERALAFVLLVDAPFKLGLFLSETFWLPALFIKRGQLHQR